MEEVEVKLLKDFFPESRIKSTKEFAKTKIRGSLKLKKLYQFVRNEENIQLEL